ncbi:hypothetical protein F6X95_01165 [Enterococcus durans]|uniref:Uncharacterized protein n=2 Tax=Enterococcus TaxID=1350 RepID=A0A5N0Z2H3_9ENTE|nr:hypothetical protein [Enterococcus durans]KAA9188008.1 hypothetical protein F6X85_02165 [Enterococcus durans]KAA9208724.1 hypothetical protein F6X95_01165 [Enterococcus durans]NJE63708.1 hypothetical protein [Enterococcus durans]PQD35762.1 hypothetical protein CUM72_10670 [Enterococcus durans]
MMMKYSGMISVVFGLLVNLLLFVDDASLVLGLTSVIPVFILGAIGTVIAIFGFLKLSNNYLRMSCVVGGLLNLLPILYFIFLIFAIG